MGLITFRVKSLIELLTDHYKQNQIHNTVSNSRYPNPKASTAFLIIKSGNVFNVQTQRQIETHN